MAQVQSPAMEAPTAPRQIPGRTPPTTVAIPPPASFATFNTASQARNSQIGLNTFSPVNQNGSFEFDRVLKSGYVQKRTRKTKAWKPIFLVLRPNSLSIYKDQNEDKLKHKIHLTDLTAVAFLKDPKQKRQNVFGLFSPSRNYHLEANSHADLSQWVQLIRQEARIEEDEEELLLASPGGNATGSYTGFNRTMKARSEEARRLADERIGSSSPEPSDPIPSKAHRNRALGLRRPSHTFDYSGNELASHSDMSENEGGRNILSNSTSHISALEEPLAVQAPASTANPAMNASQLTLSPVSPETDPERVVWQGHLLYLRTKGGVRQWKDLWAVIRPRNIALYKNDSEYAPILIIAMGAVINAVEIDPLSRSKTHCLQIITEEKSYKFCAREEGELDGSLGALKSLLARRREGEGVRRS